jgi:hypothetical protein
MSTHGSYLVDVKPQAVHMTSDRKIPENTLWAMQQSPWPARPKTVEVSKQKKGQVQQEFQ